MLELKSTARTTARRPEIRPNPEDGGGVGWGSKCWQTPLHEHLHVPGTGAWAISGFWTVDSISCHHLKIFSNFTEKSILLKNRGTRTKEAGRSLSQCKGQSLTLSMVILWWEDPHQPALGHLSAEGTVVGAFHAPPTSRGWCFPTSQRQCQD